MAEEETKALSEEEHRLRDRLRAKREEERLRNLIKSKSHNKQSSAENGKGESEKEDVTKELSEPDIRKRKETQSDEKEPRHHQRRAGDSHPPVRRSSSPHNGRRSFPPGHRSHHHHHHHPRHLRDPLRPPPRQGDPYDYRGDRVAGPPSRPPRADDMDPFGRQRRLSPGRSHSYSRSRSRSRSRSSRSPEKGGGRRSRRSPSPSMSSYSRSGSSHSSSGSGSSCSSYSESSQSTSSASVEEDEFYSKDQRTVFVTQLVMRTTERDIRKFFKTHHMKTNEIILLRDRHTGKHKGSAYVELKRMQDVIAAVNLSGQPPDFQRFPILIKASEAERNHVNSTATSSYSGVVATLPGGQAVAAAAQPSIKLPPLTDAHGKPIQAQKVYVGNLEATLVTTQHLQALFSPFGTLTEINLQTGKGFAFLQFYDPKEAALAIQTMAGQMLAGRPMKTGWATNQVSANGIEIVTAHEFPPDAATRTQNAYAILAQLTSGAAVVQQAAAAAVAAATPVGSFSRVPTVAEARASLAAGHAMGGVYAVSQQQQQQHYLPVPSSTMPAAVVDPTKIGNAEHPTQHVLVHNMFDKDEEIEVSWENDIREEFEEECSKYGKIVTVTVISKEPGGKIYASFDHTDGAKTCASSLAGRWFDKRQLRVEFVVDAEVERVRKKYPPL